MKKLLFLFLILTTSIFAQLNILPAEEAFKAHAEEKDDFVFFTVKMPEGVYLMDENFIFEVIKPKKIDLMKYTQKSFPDEYNGKKVYFSEFEAIIPIETIKQKGIKKEAILKFTYQGCANGGITCYPPMSESITINLAKIGVSSSGSEHGQIAAMFLDKSAFFVLLSFFGFGLLLSLTPCVYPMIPILSSIIVQNSKDGMSSRKGLFLSFIYVFASSITYAIAGALAGIFGANIQSALQNFWVILIFSLLFVLLALSMFGAYKIDLPSSFKTKVSKLYSGKSGLFGVALMGFLSALIVGPCVAAPLAGALLYISQSGDAFFGGAALFVMSFGMGVPLLIIGFSAGKFLPKPGIWMNRVMNFFGIVLLFMAVWMLSRVIPENIALAFCGFIVIGASLYFGILNKDNAKSLRIASVVLLILGVLTVIGSLTLLNPSLNFTSQKTAYKDKNYLYIDNLKELNELVKDEKKPIMVKFTAAWCSICKEIDSKTLGKESVKEKLKEFTLVGVDVTKNSENDKELLSKFDLYGPPALIFFKNQNELKHLQIVGFKAEDEFLKHLEKVLNE